MRTKILSIFVFTLLTTSFLGFAISAEESFTSEKIDSIVLSDPIILEDDEYITLDFQEANSQLMQPGNPILPTYSKIYKFPFGTKIRKVECIPSMISQKQITGVIKPAPEPILVGNVKSQEKENVVDYPLFKDSAIYNSKEFFPNKWFDYSIGCGLDGTDRVVFLKIQFYPAIYSPALNLVKYSNKFDIKLEYKEPASPVTFPDQYDLVIIAPTEFSEKLQPLVSYKNDCGRDTIFVSLDEIYDGEYFPVNGRDKPEKIKYFLKDAIENWNITYVLLAGGINKVPARPSYAQDGQEINFISDLYYADIYMSNGDFCSWDSNENDYFGEYGYEGRTDTVDLYPDICLGRLNFRNIDEIDSVIDKLITYESSGAYMQEWFSDFVVIGGDTFEDSSNVLEGEFLNSAAVGLMADFNPEYIWVSNGKLKFAVNVDSAVENGSGFLYMTGHGTHDNWVTHPHMDFDTWWPLTGYYYFRVELLDNGEMLPVVVIGGCSNAQFTGNSCFAWSWLKNPDGGGIATYGYSALGWGYPGYGCTGGLTGGMEMSAFKAYGTFEANTPGDLWVKALNNYINEFGVYFGQGYKCVEEWQPFSDPSMRIRKISDFPNVPDTPDGPTSGGVGLEYTYSSMSTDPNGGYIKYGFDWGDGTIGWTDWYSSGQECMLSHKWESPGEYEIKVKARDQYGLDSGWSDTLTVTIVSQAPFFDIINVKGGLGSVSTTIKNIGMLEAYDVNCNISVTGGLLSLIDVYAEKSYETVAVDQEISFSADGIFGLGKINVVISASSPSANTTTESYQGFVLGPLVIV